nr:toll/interleukin-1 receptor domain-containing protein [Pseudomonadota bacterium]
THIYNTIKKRFTHQEIIEFLDELGEGAAPPGYAYGSRGHFFISLKYLKRIDFVQIANRLNIEAYPKEWDNSFSAKAFISYESKNKDFALDIQDVLELYNIESFAAAGSIKTSEIFDDKIAEALKNMDFFISLHTKGFSKSLWCQQEVGFAMGRGVEIIPIMVDEKPQGLIERHNAINGKQDLELIADNIRLALKNNPKTTDLYYKKVVPYIYEEEEDIHLETHRNADSLYSVGDGNDALDMILEDINLDLNK